MALRGGKRATLFNQIIIQIILIAVVFAIFLVATADKINARGVRQQVLEKQTALLIDAAVPGMTFEINKGNVNGVVQGVELKDGKVFVTVEGLGAINGYPYFSRYSVNVVEEEDKFLVVVDE